ncbi:MAG: hypothetical protein KIS81_01275 [Maricaulaceae bacterium]|nr:hypothetical protein [Maricaulaceae bacterium]
MELLIPLAPFIMVIAIVWLVYWFGSKNRRAVHETIRTAIQSGQQLTPETIKALGAPQAKKGGDVTSGVVLIAVALAFITLGWAIQTVEGENAFVIMTGVASFPGFIGLALLGLAIARRRGGKAED